MNRIKIKKLAYLVLLFSVFSFGSFNFTDVYSNPIPIYGERFGGIFTGNTSLSMQHAEVLFNLDERNKGKEFHISFFGNYTIFNSNDTDITLQIYNPIFSIASISNSSKIQVFVNDMPVDFMVINKLPDTLNLTKSHLQVKNDYGYIDYYFYQFIVCNASFKAKSTTLLRYIIKYNLYFADCDIYFSYYVGSARCWSGNTTETVTFIVKGKQPEDYAANCSIMKISKDTYQYQWQWDNKPIMVNSVYVQFSINSFDFSDFLALEFFVQVFIGLPTVIIYAIVKIAKTKEFDV